MSRSNIDRFDEIVGRVFADLYESFPVPLNLRVENYLQRDTEPEPDPFDGALRYMKEEEIIESTIRWLANAGFLTSGKLIGGSFTHAILTPKGLECLKLTPDSIKGPAGSQLAAAVKSGSIATLKMVASSTIGVGARITANKLGFDV